MNNDVLTSGEVARICNVSSPTVIKWIDSGMLKGFRIPGSKARRVARKDLLAFMVEHGMPLENLNDIKTKILVIDDNVNFCNMLKREFDLDGSFDALIVQNAFRAGTMLEEFKPDIVLLDVLLDGINGKDVCKFLRQNADFNHIKVIGTSGVYSQESIMEHDTGGFDGFLKKPFKFSELKEKIYELQNAEPSTLAKRQIIEHITD
ncbi:MAG TPA: response regulator [Candidatus Brocadiia bacterium]|nr:response regulator [Candidatus Brocadiales bacterium]